MCLTGKKVWSSGVVSSKNRRKTEPIRKLIKQERKQMILCIKEGEIWMQQLKNKTDYNRSKWKSKTWSCITKPWKKLSSKIFIEINVLMERKLNRKSVMQKKKKCKLKKCSTTRITNIQPKPQWLSPWSNNNKQKQEIRKHNNYKKRKWEQDKWCMRKWPERRVKGWSMKVLFKEWNKKN